MKIQIINADAIDGLRTLPDQSVQTVITSPPYWALRDYGVEGQIGLEATPEEYVARMVEVFREVRRVLRDDGTLWLNLGDSYAGSGKGASSDKENPRETYVPDPDSPQCAIPKVPRGLKSKDLVGIPWRVAFALQADGWYLRSDIIWHKPNPMPESVTDRPTKSHEYVFLLAKQARYFYDADAVREANTGAGWERSHADRQGHGNGETGANVRFGNNPAGRNRRTVWEIATQPFSADLQTVHCSRVGLDVVCDGMTHIVSPNCPVHGGLIDLLTTVVCDGRAGDLMSHIERNDTHRAQELLDDCVPTGSRLALDYGLDNLGSLLRECVHSATVHNTQNRRTGHGLSTSPACMPSERIPFHTDDIQALREFFELQKNILSNNTLPDELDAHSLARIPFRNVGILSLNTHNNCLCSFYKSFTKKSDHFATFPEALVEPCIKAGSAVGDTVLDPFSGSGTVALVARRLNRSSIGIELNPKYVEIQKRRLGISGQACLETGIIEYEIIGVKA